MDYLYKVYRVRVHYGEQEHVDLIETHTCAASAMNHKIELDKTIEDDNWWDDEYYQVLVELA
jgi:sensor domain CHASE-containing protein